MGKDILGLCCLVALIDLVDVLGGLADQVHSDYVTDRNQGWQPGMPCS